MYSNMFDYRRMPKGTGPCTWCWTAFLAALCVIAFIIGKYS